MKSYKGPLQDLSLCKFSQNQYIPTETFQSWRKKCFTEGSITILTKDSYAAQLECNHIRRDCVSEGKRLLSEDVQALASQFTDYFWF